MKVKCIKDVPFTSAKKGRGYLLTSDGTTNELMPDRSIIYIILKDGKVHPSLTEYFEIVPEKDFEWYLERTIEKISKLTSLLDGNTYEWWIRKYKDESLHPINLRLITSELYRTIADDLNDGWVANAGDINQEKWCNYYNSTTCTVEQSDDDCYKLYGLVYFKDKATAKQAAEIMGDKIKFLL